MYLLGVSHALDLRVDPQKIYSHPRPAHVHLALPLSGETSSPSHGLRSTAQNTDMCCLCIGNTCAATPRKISFSPQSSVGTQI